MREKYRVGIAHDINADYGAIGRLYKVIYEVVRPFALLHKCELGNNIIFLSDEECTMLSLMLPSQYYLKKVLCNDKP